MIDTVKINTQITTINKEVELAKTKYRNYELYTTHFLKDIAKDIETTIKALENTTENTKKHDTITKKYEYLELKLKDVYDLFKLEKNFYNELDSIIDVYELEEYL